MQIEEVKVIPSPVEIIFTEDKDFIKKEIDKIYETNKDKLQQKYSNLRGFRSGHVPRSKIESLEGTNNLYGKILDASYSRMLDELDKEVVGLIRFTVLNKDGEITTKEDTRMSAVIDVKPNCLINDDVKFELERIEPVVPDEELQARINMEINSKTRLETVEEDRNPEKGDVLLIDFKGSLNGKEVKEASAENFKYTIGKTKFIDGFEDVLLTMKASETKTEVMKFPNDYPNKKFQGKKVSFEISLVEINKNYIPTIEEAAELESRTVEEYTQTIKDRLMKLKEQASENDLDEKISNQVIEACNFGPIPESMVLKELRNDQKIEQEFQQLIQMNKDKVDEISGKKIGNLEQEDLNRYRQGVYSKYRGAKERNIKIDLATEVLCKHFKLEATKEDIDEFFGDAVKNGYFLADKADKLKQKMETDKYFKKYIGNSVLNKKLVKHIKETF